ncbi:Multiple epidermal growth factor-like domains protein 6, partial [Stegodyphus mimosarum]
MCEIGYYGLNCNEVCRCNAETTANCDFISGNCTCFTGWTGELCDIKCSNGSWGVMCKNMCTCAEGISCHYMTGKCMCDPGWTGSDCIEKCPFGTFGKMCEEICPYCSGNSTCHHVTGACDCPRSLAP